MRFFSKIRDIPYYLAAVATVALVEDANASTVGDAATSLQTQVTNIGKLAIYGVGLGGIIMLGAGLMKLKAAADSQGGQVKYAEGIWRIIVGAGMVAIPAFSGMMTSSLSLGTTQAISTNPSF